MTRHTTGGTSKTQRERILELFLARPGQWIPLWEILDLKISQFGARLLELRAEGYVIVNRKEWHGSQQLSWYRLESEPTPTRIREAAPATQTSDSLFGDLSPERSYLE
jgi:Helix-turn-helix domain